MRWIVLVLALVCFGCQKRTVLTVKGKTAEEWSKVVETAQKSDQRIDALIRLNDICLRDAAEVPFLAAGLKHADSNVRRTTLTFLRDLGPKASAATDLLKAMVNNEEEEASLRKDAEAALQAISPPPAAPVGEAPPPIGEAPAK